MEKKIDLEKMFAAIYRSLHINKGVAESMDRELNRQGFVAIDTPDGVRFEEIKPLQYTNDAPLNYDNKLNPIYPTELAESEDEKIIKSVTRLVKAFHDVNFPTPEGFSRKDLLAWLDKQGEKKSISKIPVSEKLYEHIRNTCACIDDAMSSERIYEVKDYIEQASKDAQDAFDMIEKQGDQNPAWSEEDEKIYNRIYDIVHSAAYTNYDVDDDGKECGEYAKLTAWLKSLKGRVQLQPKQEWSEEDNAMLVNLVAWIEGKWGTLGGKVGGKEAYISFLKSIQERYAWKPSGEQIKALKEVVDEHFDIDGGALWHLYDDLKKLMEE